MCKRSYVDTYLRVNALQDNAQPGFSLLTITVDHSLERDLVVFFYRSPIMSGMTVERHCRPDRQTDMKI